MNNTNTPPYLDTPEAVRQIDKENIAKILADFPNQLASARAGFAKIDLPKEIIQVKQVVFCGMGGSAIGAEVACDLSPGLIRKPLAVIRDYDLPAWINKETAVVVISYSGETAEALACFNQALSCAGVTIVVTSGGQLADQAVRAGVPLYKFDYKSPPRDALGYMLVPAIMILEKAGILNSKEADLTNAINLIQEISASYLPTAPTPQNKAKQLAYSLYDHVPIVVGSNITKSVARRWKNQFNEHSKNTSWFDCLPEANHNTVEGFGFPIRFKDDVVILLLESHFDHPEIVKRQSLWREQLIHQGIQAEAIEGQGEDIWANKLSLIYLGDWVSYYLALLYRIDPAEIPIINKLKAKLGAD